MPQVTLGTELRDGVAIDSKTRTAMRRTFNMELLKQAHFNLRFELACRRRKEIQ